MSASSGNQFWRNRSRHGRVKLFQTPELLWQAATEYFDWVDANPWLKIEQRNQTDAISSELAADAISTTINLPVVRPYTLSGLCLYCKTSRQWWSQFKKNESNKGYLDVITRIEEIIYSHKFQGAVVGAFSPSIINRDLGLQVKRKQDAMQHRQIDPFRII